MMMVFFLYEKPTTKISYFVFVIMIIIACSIHKKAWSCHDMTWHDHYLCMFRFCGLSLSIPPPSPPMIECMWIFLFSFSFWHWHAIFFFLFISMIINWLLAIWSHHQLRMMVYKQSLSSSDLKILLQKKKKMFQVFFPLLYDCCW